MKTQYLVGFVNRDKRLDKTGRCFVRDRHDPNLVVISERPQLLPKRDADEVFAIANRMLAGRVALVSGPEAQRHIPRERWR